MALGPQKRDEASPHEDDEVNAAGRRQSPAPVLTPFYRRTSRECRAVYSHEWNTVNPIEAPIRRVAASWPTTSITEETKTRVMTSSQPATPTFAAINQRTAVVGTRTTMSDACGPRPLPVTTEGSYTARVEAQRLPGRDDIPRAIQAQPELSPARRVGICGGLEPSERQQNAWMFPAVATSPHQVKTRIEK